MLQKKNNLEPQRIRSDFDSRPYPIQFWGLEEEAKRAQNKVWSSGSTGTLHGFRGLHTPSKGRS